MQLSACMGCALLQGLYCIWGSIKTGKPWNSGCGLFSKGLPVDKASLGRTAGLCCSFRTFWFFFY